MKEKIESYIEAFQTAYAKIKQRYERISVFRLIAFLIGIAGALVVIFADQWWGWIPAGAGGLIFIFLVFYHSEVQLHLNTLERLLQVYRRYQQRLQGEWNSFSDTGIEFREKENTVADDLDIFGENSLYQLLCTAHTPYGRQRLAEVLQPNNIEKHVEQIIERQQAVAELANKSEFSLALEASAMACEEEQQAKWKNSKKKESQETKDAGESKAPALALQILGWCYPAIMLIVTVGTLLHWWNAGVLTGLFLIGLLFSFLISGYCQKKIEQVIPYVSSMEAYLYMMDAVAVQDFETSYLKQLQGKLTGQETGQSLLQGMKKLERILNGYQLRFNPILHWLLSGICLYDIHLVIAAGKWEKKYGDRMQEGIRALGEIEMLSSLAVMDRIRKVTYPKLVAGGSPEIFMEQVTHPLLPEQTAVGNTISLKGETVVITGSNMSGKTTFLRTVGINLVLAYAGAPVCADSCTVSCMQLFTSMRVVDDVQHGISTFYAEILRIKGMVEYGKTGFPMICLIDEIFRGTNSADRIVGAETVIRKLSNPSAIVMVSTHDFELCSLAKNYHFEEYYENDQIRFDYSLREGKCTTTNALFLLKMAGLTEEQ